MKQVKVRFPVDLADKLATEMYSLNCNTILSWLTEGVFETSYVWAIVAVPDESVTEFQTIFKHYMK